MVTRDGAARFGNDGGGAGYDFEVDAEEEAVLAESKDRVG